MSKASRPSGGSAPAPNALAPPQPPAPTAPAAGRTNMGPPPVPASATSSAPVARPKRALPKFNKKKSPTEPAATPVQAPNATASASTHSAASSSNGSGPNPSHPVAEPQPRPRQSIPPGYTHATEWEDSIIFAYDTQYLPPYPGKEVFAGEVADDGLFHRFEYIRQPTPYDESSPQMLFARVPRPGREDADEFRAAWPEDWDEERLLPVAVQRELRQKRGEEDMSEELIKVGYFSRQKTHDVERMRVHDLKDDYEEAVSLVREVLRRDKLKEDDVALRAIQKMRLPDTIVSTMWKSWGRMHFFGLLTSSEYETCHRVYQRCALEIDAWLDMIAAFLEPVVRERPNHCLFRRLSLGPSPRRGAIFAGEDIITYHALYRKLRAPTYVNIAREDLDPGVLAGVKLSKPDRLRCSDKINIKLSTIRQKTLPFSWYPPLHARWDVFELQARGYAPREESEDTFQPADVVEARKRKSDHIEQHNKRIKLAREVQEERRDDKFHRRQRDVGTSRERYALYASVSPAFRRQFDRLAKPRQKWLPTVYAPYSLAEGQVLSHARLSVVDGQGEGSLWTFLPPVHLIASDDPLRTARILVNVVHTLPILLLRIKFGRTDKRYTRFGSRGWRKFGAKVVAKEDFWAEGGGKINKHTLLAGREFERLRKLPEAQRPWGKLPCGHEATVELLHKDEQLQASLCYSINQWQVLFVLCSMATRESLDAAGIPELSDDGGTHRTPDFMDLDRDNSHPALNAARDVAMLRRPINEDGWPALWAPDTLNVNDRRRWLKAFAKLLAAAKGREQLDAYMRKRTHEAQAWDAWALGNLLRDVNPFQPLTPEREESLEDHLMLRYMLTSLSSLKQWPIEFLDRPRGDFHQCGLCREEERKKREEERGAPGEEGMTERFEEEWDLMGEQELEDED
ncbi:unnamed protein product [Peniophora sp. CBMAI 1063]|nr:unnamed protein product [Peniophora sp. CBMAI 1063]